MRLRLSHLSTIEGRPRRVQSIVLRWLIVVGYPPHATDHETRRRDAPPANRSLDRDRVSPWRSGILDNAIAQLTVPADMPDCKNTMVISTQRPILFGKRFSLHAAVPVRCATRLRILTLMIPLLAVAVDARVVREMSDSGLSGVLHVPINDVQTMVVERRPGSDHVRF